MTTFHFSTGLSALCGAMLWVGVSAQANEAQADESAIDLPSLAQVTLLDVITNVPGQGLTYRFRFLAPHIQGDVDFDTTMADMQFLCDSYALPRLSTIGPVPHQIVITLLDRPVPFGEISPEVIQFFEAYRPDTDRCLWENF